MTTILAARQASNGPSDTKMEPDTPNSSNVKAPCLKIVIRLLPPLLLEDQFWNQAQSYSQIKKEDVEWYYCAGLNSQKAYEPPVYSRCYILFQTKFQKDKFIEETKGKPFLEEHTNDMVVPKITNAPFFNDMPNWKPQKSLGLRNKEIFQEFTKYLNGEISSFGLSKKSAIETNKISGSKLSVKTSKPNEVHGKRKRRRKRKSLRKAKEDIGNTQNHGETQDKGRHKGKSQGESKNRSKKQSSVQKNEKERSRLRKRKSKSSKRDKGDLRDDEKVKDIKIFKEKDGDNKKIKDAKAKTKISAENQRNKVENSLKDNKNGITNTASQGKNSKSKKDNDRNPSKKLPEGKENGIVTDKAHPNSREANKNSPNNVNSANSANNGNTDNSNNANNANRGGKKRSRHKRKPAKVLENETPKKSEEPKKVIIMRRQKGIENN